VVDFILSRKRYSDDEMEDFAFGVQRLLKDGVLIAAYPLHDVSFFINRCRGQNLNCVLFRETQKNEGLHEIFSTQNGQLLINV
jgi:hypothetical protein